MPIPYLEQEHEKKMNVQATYMFNLSFVSTFVRAARMCNLTSLSTSYIAEQTNSPSVTHPFPSATQHDLGNPNFWEREGKGGVGALEYATCNISSSGFKLSKLACKIGSRIEQGSQRSPMVRQEPLAADPNPHLPCPANIIAAPIRGRTLTNSTLGTASSNGTIAHATARVGRKRNRGREAIESVGPWRGACQ